MSLRVVADAEVRGAVAVIVEGENGLLFQVVVNLHGAVTGSLIIGAVAEIVLAVARAGDILIVVGAVIALPEFDVPFFECSGFNTGDIGGDCQICDIVRNDSGCFSGHADGREVLGEGIHFRISPGLFVLFVGEFDKIADSFEISDETFGVVDFVSVLEIRFRIEFVDELETFGFGHEALQFRNIRREGECADRQSRQCKMHNFHSSTFCSVDKLRETQNPGFR